MSPLADLAPVAAAGRRTGQMYQTMLSCPEGSGGALPYLATAILTNIGQGGVFDYRRQGNHLTGFAQLRQYRDVSNFNVGLFCQQAGLPLEEVLEAAGRYARIVSGNGRPDQPYGLDSQTAEFIKTGYAVGQSGTGEDGISISIPSVSDVVFMKTLWMDRLIKYNIGHIDYPKPDPTETR
jgi:hypothetical protein